MALILAAAFAVRDVNLPFAAETCFAVGTCLLVAAAWNASANLRFEWQRFAAYFVSAVCHAGMGLLSGVSIIAAAAVSLASLAGLTVAERLTRRTKRAQRPVSESPVNQPLESIDHALEARLLSRLTPALDISDAELDDEEEIDSVMSFSEAEREVTLRVERGISPDGTEWIEGAIKVEFLTGQRLATIHLPLWPALNAIPEVSCETLLGRNLQIKVAGRYRWGIRLELSRQSSVVPPEVAEIAFFIRDSNLRSEAA